ncbi:MAG: c-type cytochrome [Crocinitomicaceae bacterium]|nr:MAG: c-type cytochrome [Crocinitomicaceae bacterium]
MKIFINQMFRSFNKWCFGAIAFLLFAGTFDAQAQGEGLFKSKCATCHQPHKDGTGPKLFGVREKWTSGGAKEGSIIKWVNNWQAAAASDPYAEAVSKVKPTAMNAFPDLTEEQIVSIFDWVDTQVEAPAGGDGPTDGPATMTDAGAEEEADFSWIWIVMGVVFFTIILAVGGVRRQLKSAINERDGVDTKEDASYAEEFRTWAWKNKIYVGIGSLVLVLTLLVTGIQGLGNIGVVEAYQPSQPIEFPHSVHAGVNGIDCRYCHNSVTKSKSASLPTVNVCMNCHKQINGRDAAQQEKIKAVYEAAGWDGSQYTGKSKPIVWNKVHVLPDHVYFNHSQHVTVGGIDCKQCHGDMKTQKETARVVPVEELNKIEGNVVLTKPTLTMGWCIECHQEKGIADGPLNGKKDGYYDEIHKRLLNNDKTLYNKYLEDGKVSVKELGGWECAKCHY